MWAGEAAGGGLSSRRIGKATWPGWPHKTSSTCMGAQLRAGSRKYRPRRQHSCPGPVPFALSYLLV